MKRKKKIAVILSLLLLTLGMCITAAASEPQNPTPGESETANWKGSYVYFGKLKGEPIKWRVLRVEANTLLLMSDRVLAFHGYGSLRNSKCQWADSEARKYLNQTLLYQIFTEEEIRQIADSSVSTNPYPFSNDPDRLNGGPDTLDKLFLPSYEDIKSLTYGFGGAASRRALRPDSDEYVNYWLRSPGEIMYGYHYNMLCRSDGVPVRPGVFGPAITWEEGIRPMLRVRKDSKAWSMDGDGQSSYSITLDANSGYFYAGNRKISKQTYDVVSSKTYGSLPTPSRKNYAFAGWYTKKSGGTLIGQNTVVISKTTHTLYAHWTKRKNLNKATVKVSSCTYTGGALKPAVTVKYNKTTLIKGKDFTVDYTNNVNASSKARITITGIGSYIGTIKKNFTISARSFKGNNVLGRLSASSYTYNGKAKTPSVSLSYGTKVLKKGKDYTCTYKNNTNAGKATVVVKGRGNYRDSKTFSFQIAKAAQSITYQKEIVQKKSSKDQKYNLKVKGAKEGAKITFSSSNPKVASVSNNGYVTVKKQKTGLADITIKVAGTKNYKPAKKLVKVYVRTAPSVSISADPIAYGEESYLIVHTKSKGKITFKSANTNILAIDKNSGKMTAKKPGKAKVTVKIDAFGTYASTSKTIVVTVQKKDQIIEAKDILRTIYDGDFSIGARLATGNGTLTFTSSDKGVLEVSPAGSVKVKGAGTAAVLITASATENYKKAEKVIQISIESIQKAKWFMNYLNITQVPGGDYSHRGTQNFDVVGSNGDNNIFAPFDCRIVAVYPQWIEANTVVIESIHPVLYANGEMDYMSIAFGHDDDISDLYVGKEIRQGDTFYQTGTYGPADGRHCHVTCIKGRYQGDMWTIMDQQAKTYSSPHGISPITALFLDKNTKIIENLGMNFVIDR